MRDFSKRFKSLQVNPSLYDIELPKIVSEYVDKNLVKPIQDLEIEEAIFQKDQYKAPNPNGSKVTFFKDCWNLILKGVCRAIKSFFQEGKPLKQIKHMYAHCFSTQGG